MNRQSLENAIIDEAQQTIRSLTVKEADEIRRLDEAFAAEINAFQDKTRSQTDAKIGQESAKAENRAALDLKKLKLKSLEDFINGAVKEAMKTIRIDPIYKKFLVNNIVDAVRLIPGEAEIRLMKEDINLEKEIKAAMKAVDGTRNITVNEDGKIMWGGCIIKDTPGGRVFDCTIERVFFRKSTLIRREVMALLHERINHGQHD